MYNLCCIMYNIKLELIYYEAYKSERDARLREKMLKHFGSSYSKLKLRLTDSLL